MQGDDSPSISPNHSGEAKSSTESEDMGGGAGSQQGGEMERQPVSAGEKKLVTVSDLPLSFRVFS